MKQVFPSKGCLTHRYLWTGPYVAPFILLLFFFLRCCLPPPPPPPPPCTPFFFIIELISCQKPGMDRNYCLIVFIVYMSYSDT